MHRRQASHPSLHARWRVASKGARALAYAAALGACSACGRAGPSARERATSLAREHREGDAVRVLQEQLARHPEDVQSRRLLVRVLALAGDLRGARGEASKLADQLGDRDPLPFIELGHAFELAHQFEQALEMYDAASELSPSDPRGPREGGMRAARWGELEWARPRLEEAVRRAPGDARTWHALGLVRLHGGDLRAAEEAYLAGLRADPSAADCLLGIATVAVRTGDGVAALRAYDAILAARPSFAPAHLGRAWALARLGRKDEARLEIDVAERAGAGGAFVAAQRRALDGSAHDARAAGGTELEAGALAPFTIPAPPAPPPR